MTFNDFVLPWESSRREDERYRKILKRLLILFLLLALVFPWLPLPQIEREEVERLPPTLAKVMLQQKLPPAPPPQPVKKEAPAEKSPSPAKKKKVQQAKKKVASMGVAAFSKELQSLRSSLDVAKLQARNTNIKTGAASKSTRSVLGRDAATKTSGGIASSVTSTNGSGTQLAGRSGVSVDSPLGGGGEGVDGGGGGGRHGSSVPGGRDMESIRRVFEQHKGAIYAIYNRALRRDPAIKGKFVFHIVIEPSGAISKIELVSSELGKQTLEGKLLTRIRIIDFGPEEVAATPVNYRFDFLPG